MHSLSEFELWDYEGGQCCDVKLFGLPQINSTFSQTCCGQERHPLNAMMFGAIALLDSKADQDRLSYAGTPASNSVPLEVEGRQIPISCWHKTSASGQILACS